LVFALLFLQWGFFEAVKGLKSGFYESAKISPQRFIFIPLVFLRL
jgi:hypothetical protein